MSKSIKGTQTEKNLLTSFAGESQARMRYTYFAGVAKKEGFEQIAAIFTETADQEKEHAERLFKLLEGGEVEISAAFPAGVIGTTSENLLEAANGEHYETNTMYPEFAKIAEAEGHKELARLFNAIGKVEVEHEREYKALQDAMKEDGFFTSENEDVWVCEVCGHIHRGKKAPGACPLCKVPKEYFKRESLGI